MKKDKLHNIKKNGFTVPEGYFDSLEDNIIDELKVKESVTNTGFKVPDNYFENLEDSVLSKVSNLEKDTKVIKLFSRKTILFASSIAAAILLLFNLSIFTEKATEPDFETVENYILNEDISTYEIASLLEEEELTEENFIEFSIEEDTVEDYILDNLYVEDLY